MLKRCTAQPMVLLTSSAKARSAPYGSSFERLMAAHPDNAQFEASKILVHTDRIAKWLSSEIPSPVTLELDITLSCNDRCPNCVHGFALQNRHLLTEQIEHILADAESCGVKGLTLTGGGDPLRHPQFFRVLESVRSHTFAAGLFTNGGLITTQRLADAMVTTFQWIRVSLDSGSEAEFRRVRGHSGYRKRLDSILRLVVARNRLDTGCELGVSFLTSEMAADDILAAASDVRDMGFDYIQFKPMIHWSAHSHHQSVSLNQSNVFESIQRARELEDGHFRVLLSGKKYEADVLHHPRMYSAFHSAWFIASVGPSMSGAEVKPTLYLDCSAKYLDRWTIAQFDRLPEVLNSRQRREMLNSVSSEVFCVPSEKHAAYNHQLESILLRHRNMPLSIDEIRAMAPEKVKHPYSL